MIAIAWAVAIVAIAVCVVFGAGLCESSANHPDSVSVAVLGHQSLLDLCRWSVAYRSP